MHYAVTWITLEEDINKFITKSEKIEHASMQLQP